jgi:hypothetical protein
MIMDPSESLKQAIDAARAGDIQFASRLLARIVADTPNNDVAWLWLAASLDQPNQQMFCLQKAQAINPTNPGTLAELEAYLFPAEQPEQQPVMQSIPLPATTETAPVAPVTQESTSIPMPPPREPIPEYQPPAEPQPAAKRGSHRALITIVIILVVAILVVIAALVWFVFSGNPQLIPSLIQNLIQSGGLVLPPG